ncbi:MAG: hypothetical protein AAFZ52_10625 [Bacteroidota bacterium]
MQQLLYRLPLGVLLVAILTLSACEKDNFAPSTDLTAEAPVAEVVSVSDDGISQNVASITGAEMIAALQKTRGDVSDLTGEEIVQAYFDERALSEANALRPANSAAKATDVYSTFITATIIPSITSPPSAWTTFYETSPPIIGLPTSNSVRTLTVTRCPNFFQITTTANAYRNGVSLSGRSATRSNNPSCSGRQIRSFARAILYTFGSATTQASVSCVTNGPFCAISIDPVEFEPIRAPRRE